MDVVGLYCFVPLSPSHPTRYRTVKVPSHLALDRVLHRTCRDLQGLAGKEPTPLPGMPALAGVAEDLSEEGGLSDVEESPDD